MNITIDPKNISGKLNIIFSKSYLHRMIISACLSNSVTRIDNVYYSEDVLSTINNLREIVKIDLKKNHLIVDGRIKKCGIKNFEVNESGSTLRFLIPVLSYLNDFEEIKIKIGDRLSKRPLDDYKELFDRFEFKDNILYIEGFKIRKTYNISLKKTSQIASGLLFVLPLLKEDSKIVLDSLNSISYIDKTIEILKMFSIDIKRDNLIIYIKGSQKYLCERIKAPYDENFINFLYAATLFNKSISLSISPKTNIIDEVLKNDEIDFSNNIDDSMTSIVVALTKPTATRFIGIDTLKYKESNRIDAILKCFKNVELKDDVLTIKGGKIDKSTFDSFSDHRIVMMLVLYSIINNKKITIKNFECVYKSYPTFLSELKNIGMDIEIEKPIEKISYKIFDKNTNILIKENLLDDLTSYINENNKKVVVITEKNVPTEIIEKIKLKLKKPLLYFFSKTKENIKTLKEYEKAIDFLLENNVSKSDYLIGVGGGVISDITGFVAKTYKRGINYSLIPTTLIGMIDASIGGKCGINFKNIKNAIGDFNSPDYIFIDPLVLKTLNKDELKSGMAELIKIAAISNKKLFFDILDNKPYSKINEWIVEAIKEKVKYVIIDPFDKNVRHALNYGHTYGHVIELKTKIPHGLAVAKGIKMVDDNEFINSVFKKYEINLITNYQIEELDKLIINDKKVENNVVKLVRIDNIGNFKIENKKI